MAWLLADVVPRLSLSHVRGVHAAMLSFRHGVIINICFVFIFLLPASCGTRPAIGTIRLWRNGDTLISSFGRVQIAGPLGNWGNICGDRRRFDLTEAHVICHQLGYIEASSFSRGALDTFGTDPFPLLYGGAHCDSVNYLTISQCRFIDVAASNCVDHVDDLSVICLTTRIGNNPYNGMVRLQEGMYSNFGFVEVYCNGQWGTICSDSFDSDVANTVCKQLGYARSETFNPHVFRGFNGQPIWLTDAECVSADVCISNCEMCPSSITPQQQQQCSQPGNLVMLLCGIDPGTLDISVTNMTCLPETIIQISPTISPGVEGVSSDSAIYIIIGMIVVATGVVVAIVVAVSFLAVLSWKYYKRQHTVRTIMEADDTYERIDFTVAPPALPPRTHDCVAYFKVDLADNIAYSSGLNRTFNQTDTEEAAARFEEIIDEIGQERDVTYDSIDGDVIDDMQAVKDDMHLQVPQTCSNQSVEKGLQARSLSATLLPTSDNGIKDGIPAKHSQSATNLHCTVVMHS